MDSILVRINRTIEGILENESLTDNLNDEAAKVLIDWGIQHAKEIAVSTIDIFDEEQAEEAIYARMRALRRIMQTINTWVVKVSVNDLNYGESALKRIISQADILYGAAYTPPDEASLKNLINRQISLSHAPADFIGGLLRLIENPQTT